MAVEVGYRKKLHKHAIPAALLAVVLFGGVSFTVFSKPQISSRALSALFTRAVRVSPSKNGLASIELNDQSQASDGLGATTVAGDRMHSEMNLISASEESR